MKNYTIYNSTGKILSSGYCQDEVYGYGLDPEHFIMELSSDPFSQYIKNNTLVNMPPKPIGEYDFDCVTEQWVQNPTTQWLVITAERNNLLFQSDWTQLPDVPLATKEAWATYRQELRDITEQEDPYNIVWPTKPD